jgi:hypothetical protein
MPSKLILVTPAYARSRAAAKSGPLPTTVSTRPPAVTMPPPRAAVPAWKTSVSGSAAASSRPAIGLPVSNRSGYPPDASTTPAWRASRTRNDPDSTRPPAALHKCGSSSSARPGSTTCVSGSPSLALNSITAGPSGVIINPA